MNTAAALLAALCFTGFVKSEEGPMVEILDTGDSGYFTEKWRDEYNEEKIANQPKWKLANDQPKDGRYEVREYAPAWWVTSFTPCLNQTVAASFGYLKLYIYMNKYNTKRVQYNLTYPILNKVEIGVEGPEDEDKGRDSPCPDRFSVNFYLPHPVGDGNEDINPADGTDVSIVTSKEDVIKTRFVMPYQDFFTEDSNDNCNYQAAMFGIRLALDGRKFNPNAHYCAMYERGKSGNIKFEVWFDEMAA